MQWARDRDQRLIAGVCCGFRMARIWMESPLNPSISRAWKAFQLRGHAPFLSYEDREIYILGFVGKKGGRWNQRCGRFTIERYPAVLKGLQARCIGSHRHPAGGAFLQHCAGNLKNEWVNPQEPVRQAAQNQEQELRQRMKFASS
jgi:hypothetical protein